MSGTDIAVSPLQYNGAAIQQRGEMLSLTDMWKASGSDPSKRPVEWLRSKSARAFIEVLQEMVGKSHLFATGTGRSAATMAHWQIGLAYAKYLSPEFHMWCNTVVRERMEGKVVPTAALSPEIVEMIRRDDGISRMLAHKVTQMEQVVAKIAAVVMPPHPSIVRHGKTAGQIWYANGFPKLRVTGWFGNRLAAMGCQMEGAARGELGMMRARLFDPDKAETWLKNGGRQLVENYIAERKGQTKLRLVGGA